MAVPSRPADLGAPEPETHQVAGPTVAGGEAGAAAAAPGGRPFEFRTVVIENVAPELDDGRYPIKRVVGDTLVVEADIFKEGHDLIAARVEYRGPSDPEWRRVPMAHVDNDRWRGSFLLEENGCYAYTVVARPDVYRSWVADLRKKKAAGQDLAGDLLEGARLLREAAERAAGGERETLQASARLVEATGDRAEAFRSAVDPVLAELVSAHEDPALLTRYDRELQVQVDRPAARFAAWYEIFVRSQGTDPHRSATFREAERQLPRIRAMGFDVLYLTPIHPIGITNRKGPNNTLTAGPNDPGSPYAIGGPAGGHTAVEPALGSLEDFDHFQRAVRAHGMELALDFAIQASPDHPWVREHPEWFYRRPDGTIKFAENPPKKYEDIYPLNFYSPDWRGLWEELKSVVLFWVERGVRIFRVDNPHTKPLDFWVWLIRAVQRDHPDVVFLSEAFTRPKVMKALAKAGFTQSYTYFTWRNEKREFAEYLTEITSPPVAEYFRGNLFTNTPDILPEVLQRGGRPAFVLRLILAATCSSVYGIYNGFELCENRPRPGTAEYYADSEMYQHIVRDWDRPGNIVDVVTLINRIRRENPALQLYQNLRFYDSDDEQILFYGKATPDLRNAILVAVNLDPFTAHHSWVHLPDGELGIGDGDAYEVHDLLSGARYTWRGRHNWVRLDPQTWPAHIFRVERRS
jgi:starch synthase (maltosyl-transferring)